MAQSTEAGEVFHTSSESWYRTETPGVLRSPKSHICRFCLTETARLPAGRAAGQLRLPAPPGSTQALLGPAWRPHPPLKYKGALCSGRPGCSPAPGTPRWDFLDCERSFQPSAQGELQQEPAVLRAPSAALCGLQSECSWSRALLPAPGGEQQHRALLCQRAAAAPVQHLP